jgi:DMSO/TMAO reductase YedYZ molybdopterin-dependent catalytic subunit
MSDENSRFGFRPARRQFMYRAGALGLAGIAGGQAFAAGVPRVIGVPAQPNPPTVTLPFENGERPLIQYPQKRPLIELTSRPPQLETPFSVFNEGVLTPNDAFFVRYHLAKIPLTINPATWRLTVGGNVNTPLSLSLGELKMLPQVEVVAVNQCSGNSRGLFTPRIQGGQLANGAMGNARWTGVRLKDVLARASVAEGAVQVTFNGMDNATKAYDETPDFVKALNIDHALDGEVMLAYAMNGEPLPLLNGYPLRLVVPGYYGTYWIKHLNEITVTDKVFDGFWMATGYRIPDNACACVPPGTRPERTVPINRMNVRSFITSLTDGEHIPAGRATVVKGIAFDGGSGIRSVAFSADGGASWREAQLGQDLGNYSFREWTIALTPPQAGPLVLQAKATNGAGQTQPVEVAWNPSGYMRNVIESVGVTAVKGA